MLISFQDQFVPKIQDGTKPFSIRAFRKDRYIPKPGEKLFMYHGSRYVQGKRPRVFPEGMEPEVSFVGEIKITPSMTKIKEISAHSHLQIPIDRRIIRRFEKYCPHRVLYEIINPDKFAALDGFDSFADQLAFFQKYHGLPFSGIIIFWKLHPEWVRGNYGKS